MVARRIANCAHQPSNIWLGSKMSKIGEDDRSVLAVSANSMLVFVDETGEEWFRDPHHPVFGLGGCTVAAKQ